MSGNQNARPATQEPAGTGPNQFTIPIDPTKGISISASTRVSFLPLVVHRSSDGTPLLGCTGSRRFLEVDDDTLLAIELMKAHPLGDANRLLNEKTGQEYDMADLVSILTQRGFIATIDGVKVAPIVTTGPMSRRLNQIPSQRLAWLQSPLLAVLVLGCLFPFVALWSKNPGAGPHYIDLLLLRGWPGFNGLLVFGALLVIASLHELGHFLVARSYGVEASVKLSHRFYILVLQTDVTNTWILPALARLRVFLAGPSLNLALLSVSYALAIAGETGLVGIEPANIARLRFLGYLNVFPLVFQLFIFARTDLYYVLGLAMGQRNLVGDARATIQLRTRHLWFRMRHIESERCQVCDGKVFNDEPFCLRCGEARTAYNPNRFGMRHDHLGRLTVLGVFFGLGQLFGFYFVFRILVGLQSGYFTYAVGTIIAQASGTRALSWLLIDHVLVAVLSMFQILLVLYFFWGTLRPILWSPLARLWKGRSKGPDSLGPDAANAAQASTPAAAPAVVKPITSVKVEGP